MIKKLTSKRGQVSTEMSIFITVTVVVATIVAYYYVKNVRSSGESVRTTATSTVNTITTTAKRLWRENIT